LHVGATGLNATVLGELSAMLEDSDTDELEDDMTAYSALMEKVAELLKTNPTVSVDPLVWKNDKGESKLILNLALQDGTSADPQLAELAYLNTADLDVQISRDMFLRLFGQLQGGGDPAMAESFGGMLYDQYRAKLYGAGLTAQDSGDITVKLAYADGK